MVRDSLCFKRQIGEACQVADSPYFAIIGRCSAQCRNCIMYFHGSFLGERQFTMQRQIGEAYAMERQRQIDETFWVFIFSDCIGS
jgi:hypothetical protein